MTLSAGAYDTEHLDRETGELGIEVRLPGAWRAALPARLALRPMVGATVTSDRAAWVYAGLGAHWQAGPRWVLTPSFGVSLLDEGDGMDLGGPVEFRSAIEASYAVGPALSLGLAFYHLSNAGLYDSNPGSNSLVLTLTAPLARHRRHANLAGRKELPWRSTQSCLPSSSAPRAVASWSW